MCLLSRRRAASAMILRVCRVISWEYFYFFSYRADASLRSRDFSLRTDVHGFSLIIARKSSHTGLITYRRRNNNIVTSFERSKSDDDDDFIDLRSTTGHQRRRRRRKGEKHNVYAFELLPGVFFFFSCFPDELGRTVIKRTIVNLFRALADLKFSQLK